MTMNYRDGVLQLPVFKKGFIPHQQKDIVFATGIRCPRCCKREIVYNGNYYCDGFTFPDPQCEWALPHDDNDPEGITPHYRDLWDALKKTIPKTSKRGKK